VGSGLVAFNYNTWANSWKRNGHQSWGGSWGAGTPTPGGGGGGGIGAGFKRWWKGWDWFHGRKTESEIEKEAKKRRRLQDVLAALLMLEDEDA
jgi:hypothetical protein